MGCIQMKFSILFRCFPQSPLYGMNVISLRVISTLDCKMMSIGYSLTNRFRVVDVHLDLDDLDFDQLYVGRQIFNNETLILFA